MSWQCPYATKMKGVQGLGCKKIMKDDVDYNILENKLSVFCACQRYCPECGKVINSDGARKCYDFHSKS